MLYYYYYFYYFDFTNNIDNNEGKYMFRMFQTGLKVFVRILIVLR